MIKNKVGCLVPVCEKAADCTPDLKKKCALRKYFLLEVYERKHRYQIVKNHLSAEENRKYLKAIYFWRESAKTRYNR